MRVTVVLGSALLFSAFAGKAQQAEVTAPKIIVYKTKGDYKNMVPVGLSEDKSRIIWYPAPVDLRVSEGYLKPSKLNKGYLLDNQGINKNVAFLSISYEEYANMKQVPPRDELYTRIIDKDPLLEIYDCGEKRGKQSTIIKNLRKNIRKHKLSNCNKI